MSVFDHEIDALEEIDVAQDIAFHRDEVGEGKFADIIAVKGDVLRYIDLLQCVDLVIKHGHRYK